MAERTLMARVRQDEGDATTLVVTSPVVGVADGIPHLGVFLNRFDKVLTVKILNQRYTLRLPRDVQGRVVETFIPNAYTAVSFGDALLRIDPRSDLSTDADDAGRGVAAHTAGEASGGDLIRVTSPSEGIFYRRPSPDAPAYVEVGSAITAGTVLGLVEVMKCFNQIAFGGPTLPERGEIAKVLAEDAAEVQFGQELFWVKPLP